VADALERWKQAWYERGRLAGKAEGLREAAAKFRDNQFVRRMDQRGMVQALPEYVDLWAFSPKKHADAIADWLDQKAAEIEAQLAGEERNSAHPID
jgi:flagellar biosynthesis/type III secretory pathway protein FliH